MNTAAGNRSFRDRVIEGDVLLGTFVKTAGHQGIEILGATGFDFLVIDAEHAPFDRSALDIVLLAAQAAGIPALVRVAGIADILQALDLGAVGVLVPHVHSAAMARAVASACRYQGSDSTRQRGFTNATRAGGYGRAGLHDHVQRSDAQTLAIAMIEDPIALDEIDDIVATPGIDACFLGRGDLTVAFGATDPADARVKAAVERISQAAQGAKKTLCAMAARPQEVPALSSLGVSSFILGSDQSLLRQGAEQVVSAFRNA